ncbi:TetR/AcrR family transcriptional regulator [Schleiferilactobacillus harbinensis]|jgi:AcrR family transcriptional regulator|uniref:TetR/AcrR family transcriptional regulator n=1 Tax=Schleiferilactobacillus harbinensis TaxID=304207 RepID=UPI00242FD359|nr:TetR/AcrR family transcriptional regulator [Schleiferilactobacillus harbinensis]MCI1686497.1 TetR/AcrR family transcriptional regulator [Schleiferilactobacillus harbinensis]MCI1782808.1 TetR/AcrR family transcriptional regulator [Schleiferilactobacillus harbinensis]MCI1850817.1 TetR/AcrR family transcriptional regulator [Schleiferilactobacillus harbinensis]
MKDVTTDPQKVERILHTAMIDFGQQGFLKTKTDDIAAQAGVSKGLLFHYFGSKQGLYIDTYHTAFDRLYTIVDQQVWTDATSLTDMVTRATRYKIKLQLQYPVEFRFLMQAYIDTPHFPPRLQKEMSTMMQRTQEIGNQYIAGMMQKIKLRPGTRMADVLAVVNAVTSSIMVQAEKDIASHGYTKIEELESLIEDINRQLTIVEHGFLPD